MSTEELQKKYDRLLEMTRQARGWQKQWYKYHLKADLEKAKKWERELDKFIAEEVRVKESKQPEIPWEFKSIVGKPDSNDLSFD